MKKKKKSHNLLQIKTAVDFGEEGLPLEQPGSLMDSLKRHHETLFVRKRKSGFVPIKFDAFVDLHLKSNPGPIEPILFDGSGMLWTLAKKENAVTAVSPSGL